jgi:hypothetical protein
MKKILLFLLLAISYTFACKAQMAPRTDGRSRDQAPRAMQQPLGHRRSFTNLEIHNITNGSIPYAVSYADPSKNYQSSFVSDATDVITINEACILEIPDGKFNLEKNHHYELYVNTQIHKVVVRQINPPSNTDY